MPAINGYANTFTGGLRCRTGCSPAEFSPSSSKRQSKRRVYTSCRWRRSTSLCSSAAQHHYISSVPARYISEGAAPCPYCLAPCPIIQRPARILKKKKFWFTKCNCCFCVFRQGCKNACKMLADLCPCFHQSPTKLCPGLVSFMCWIATEFWSFAL